MFLQSSVFGVDSATFVYVVCTERIIIKTLICEMHRPSRFIEMGVTGKDATKKVTFNGAVFDSFSRMLTV